MASGLLKKPPSNTLNYITIALLRNPQDFVSFN